MALPGAVITANLANGIYLRLAFGALAIFVLGGAAYLASLKAPKFFARLPAPLSVAFSRDEEGPEPRGVRFFRIAIGAVWILNAVLISRPAVVLHMASTVITPSLAGQPAPLAWLMRAGLYLWRFDPLTTAAGIAWLEVSVGLLLVAGRRERVRRVGAEMSVIVGLLVWILQQGFGGLFLPGASVLAGAPGAGLVLVGAGIFLALRNETLAKGSSWFRLSTALGIFWILAAALQAAPFENLWTGKGLPLIFGTAQAANLPGPLASPVTFLLTHATTQPTLWNLLFVVLMAFVGLGLVLSGQRRAMATASVVISLLAWWVGTAFGFVGPAGTDLGTGMALAIVSAALLVARPAEPANPGRPAAHALGVSFGLMALLVGAIPVLAALPMVVGAVPTYAAVADGGGLTTVGKPAPPFTLYDASGRAYTLASFKGKAVVLTFIDPVCYDTCAVMSKEIVDAVASLGARAGNVEMVAIDINPSFTTPESIAQYEAEHSLAGVPNWHFLTGSVATLDQVWANYGVIPTNGIIGSPSHPQVVYFIDPSGKTVAITPDSGGGSPQLIHSYSALIAATAKAALGG